MLRSKAPRAVAPKRSVRSPSRPKALITRMPTALSSAISVTSADALLHVDQHRVRPPAVAPGDQGRGPAPSSRASRASDQFIQSRIAVTRSQGEDLHEQEDQAVAEEEAHGLQVAGGARHQLADRACGRSRTADMRWRWANRRARRSYSTRQAHLPGDPAPRHPEGHADHHDATTARPAGPARRGRPRVSTSSITRPVRYGKVTEHAMRPAALRAVTATRPVWGRRKRSRRGGLPR